MSRVTVVSCYYPLPHAKHTPEEYTQWIYQFLKYVDSPIVINTLILYGVELLNPVNVPVNKKGAVTAAMFCAINVVPKLSYN